MSTDFLFFVLMEKLYYQNVRSMARAITLVECPEDIRLQLLEIAKRQYKEWNYYWMRIQIESINQKMKLIYNRRHFLMNWWVYGK